MKLTHVKEIILISMIFMDSEEPMTKIETVKALKRDTILKAALDTFLTVGYIGTSMDKIAKRAGVTKQTVYRYFSSKEALFQAALEAQRQGSRPLFMDELDRVGDPKEVLTRFAVGYLNWHMSETHLANIRLMISEGPAAPEMTRAFFSLGPKQTQTRLIRFLEERFAVSDPEYTVKLLLSTLLSMRMNVLTGLSPSPLPEEIAQHAQRTVAVFMTSLQPL